MTRKLSPGRVPTVLNSSAEAALTTSKRLKRVQKWVPGKIVVLLLVSGLVEAVFEAVF
jgi:hypothetical protein